MGVGLGVFLNAKTRKFESKMERAQRRMKTFAKVAAASSIAAGYAVGRFAMDSFDKLAAQEKAERKLESVIRSTGQAAGFTAEQLKKQAAALQQVTTFGDETVINMQAVLATFKNIKGNEFSAAQEAILDMATVLDTGLKDAAIQVGKALNDPIKGISAMSRAGVTFSREQENAIRRLVKTGDMQAAQMIMLTELQSQFGGAARAQANTVSGSYQQLSNTMGDLQEKFALTLEKELNLSKNFRKLNEYLGGEGSQKLKEYVGGFKELLGVFEDIADSTFFKVAGKLFDEVIARPVEGIAERHFKAKDAGVLRGRQYAMFESPEARARLNRVRLNAQGSRFQGSSEGEARRKMIGELQSINRGVNNQRPLVLRG